MHFLYIIEWKYYFPIYIGLGKTFSMVSLILANPPEGKTWQVVDALKGKKIKNRKSIKAIKEKDDTEVNSESSDQGLTKPKKITLRKRKKETDKEFQKRKADEEKKYQKELVKYQKETEKNITIKPQKKICRKRKSESDDQFTARKKEMVEAYERQLKIYEKNLTKKKKELSTNKETFQKTWNSTATLLIAPSRLCAQWADEIHKYVLDGLNLNVKVITTIVQFNKYSIEDICRADIVITSFNFMANTNYLNQDKYYLHNFKWHRIIIDEGHEILTTD